MSASAALAPAARTDAESEEIIAASTASRLEARVAASVAGSSQRGVRVSVAPARSATCARVRSWPDTS